MSDLAPDAPPKPKGLAATLQKKVIGPVPLWLVIGIGGGVLLLLFRRGGGASAPDAGAQPGSGAVDAASGDPGVGVGGGVGSTDAGPTGNMGGVEDPMPGFDFSGGDPFAGSFDFGGGDVSANPPASDPIYDPSAGMIPMIGGWYSPGWESPDVQADLFKIGTEYARTHPNWADPGAIPKPKPAPVSKPGTTFGGWELVSASDGGSNKSGFTQVSSPSSRSLAALVHPLASPAGRIAAATTPFTIGPTQDTVHVSSAALTPIGGARGGGGRVYAV